MAFNALDQQSTMIMLICDGVNELPFILASLPHWFFLRPRVDLIIQLHLGSISMRCGSLLCTWTTLNANIKLKLQANGAEQI